MSKITFNINNNRTLELMQPKHDDKIFVTSYDSKGNEEDIYSIPNGDMIMLLNMYIWIKKNNIHNDFVNPYGQIPSGEAIFNNKNN